MGSLVDLFARPPAGKVSPPCISSYDQCGPIAGFIAGAYVTLVRAQFTEDCWVSIAAYKRGQVEWALWRAFTLARSASDQPPAVFKTRIKRLLDLDRDLKAEDAANGPGPASVEAARDVAFGVAKLGSGHEAAYATFDVFCLGLALDLLDIGFKQSEVVTVVRHLRPSLAELLPSLLSRPSLIDRQRHLARLHPDLPVIERGNGRAPWADARVFLLLNRVELTEVLLPSTSRAGHGTAAILTPKIALGLTGLAASLDRLMPLQRRAVIIVEIAALAQAVAAFLAQAPVSARGRPKQLD